MKHRFVTAVAAILLFTFMSGSGMAPGVNQKPVINVVLNTVTGPAQFKSQLGYVFAVPAGWIARSSDSEVYLVQAKWPSGPEVFVIQTCPSSDLETCLGHPQMPAWLVKTEKTSISGRPATEYTFRRRNKETAWTREWAEVHTLVTAKDKTFDVVARIPPYAPVDLWDVYDQIRSSFRLTNILDGASGVNGESLEPARGSGVTALGNAETPRNFLPGVFTDTQGPFSDSPSGRPRWLTKPSRSRSATNR